MKRLTSCLLLFAVISACYGQQNLESLKNLKSQGNTMCQAFSTKNFKTFTKYMYPKIIEMAGGEEKMVMALENKIKEMETQGVKITSAKIGEPSEIIIMGTELQSVVPQFLEIETGKETIVLESSLIASSTNSGTDWKFTDTAGKDIAKMKSVFPTLSDKLIIPAPKQSMKSK